MDQAENDTPDLFYSSVWLLARSIEELTDAQAKVDRTESRAHLAFSTITLAISLEHFMKFMIWFLADSGIEAIRTGDKNPVTEADVRAGRLRTISPKESHKELTRLVGAAISQRKERIRDILSAKVSPSDVEDIPDHIPDETDLNRLSKLIEELSVDHFSNLIDERNKIVHFSRTKATEDMEVVLISNMRIAVMLYRFLYWNWDHATLRVNQEHIYRDFFDVLTPLDRLSNAIAACTPYATVCIEKHDGRIAEHIQSGQGVVICPKCKHRSLFLKANFEHECICCYERYPSEWDIVDAFGGQFSEEYSWSKECWDPDNPSLAECSICKQRTAVKPIKTIHVRGNFDGVCISCGSIQSQT